MINFWKYIWSSNVTENLEEKLCCIVCKTGYIVVNLFEFSTKTSKTATETYLANIFFIFVLDMIIIVL